MSVSTGNVRLQITLPREMADRLRQQAKEGKVRLSQVVHGHIIAGQELYTKDERLILLDAKLNNILDLLRGHGIEESTEEEAVQKKRSTDMPVIPSLDDYYKASA